MEITNIKTTKKGMNAIYINGKYRVSIDSETLFKSGWKVGTVLDEDAINSVISKSEQYKAMQKAIRLISYRSHSKKELTDKIKRTVDKESTEIVVDKMESLGLINDNDFCVMYAKEMFERKNYSVNRVKYELTKKGIDKDIINRVITEISSDDREQIRKLIHGKYNGKLSDEKSFRRTISSLQRLGYKWEDIKGIVYDERANTIKDDF